MKTGRCGRSAIQTAAFILLHFCPKTEALSWGPSHCPSKLVYLRRGKLPPWPPTDVNCCRTIFMLSLLTKIVEMQVSKKLKGQPRMTSADNKDDRVAASSARDFWICGPWSTADIRLLWCLHGGGGDFLQIRCPYPMAYHKKAYLVPQCLIEMSTALYLPQVAPVYNAQKKVFTPLDGY